MEISPGIESCDYELYWQPFDDAFHFRPGTEASRWPAIGEPYPSVTFDLSPIFAGDNDGFARGEDRLNREGYAAFMGLVPPEEPLVRLDWHHTSALVWPHRFEGLRSYDLTPVFPDGDYYIFFTPDLATGTFSHPWEQTICIWGEPLIQALGSKLEIWLDVKRSNRVAPTGLHSWTAVAGSAFARIRRATCRSRHGRT